MDEVACHVDERCERRLTRLLQRAPRRRHLRVVVASWQPLKRELLTLHEVRQRLDCLPLLRLQWHEAAVEAEVWEELLRE